MGNALQHGKTGSTDRIIHCTLSPKNDTDVAHYNFIVHQSILVIFGGDAAE